LTDPTRAETADPDLDTRALKRVLLVVNRHARRGAEAEADASAALQSAGLDVEHRACQAPEDLARFIRSEAGNVDAVVIGGGDGTLNSAAKALLETGLPLGIIPLGTANDLARTLGLPTTPAEAAAVVAAGRTRAVDLGLANGHPFFNVASIGMGVDLTRALTRDAKSRWGTLGYAVAGLRVLRRMRSFRAEVIQDGRRHVTRTVHLAVGNGRHYGGGMTVSETAAIDDHRLNVYSLEVRSVWKLLLLLPAMRAGTHGRWEEVKTLAGREITVRTRRRRSVNTDGEITTHTPVTFKVVPAAVRIFAP
jgi:diacylglycerol kinase (ATP)